MELTVTNRSRAYPGRSSEDSKVDDVQYVVLKVCYLCTSGSVVEYRLAKARVAGSNVYAPLRWSQANVPRTFCDVSCSQRDRKKSHPMDGSFFYVRALPGSNGLKSCLRSGRSPATSCAFLNSAEVLLYKGFRVFYLSREDSHLFR